MSGDMDDARAALRTLMRIVGGEPSGYSVVDRCRPLLGPSDAERKLDEIRNRLNSNLGSSVHALIQDITKIVSLTPPRVPQVGDTVRSVLSSRTTPRTVLDVLDDGKVLRLSSIFNRLGFNYEASDWEVVE